MTPEQAIQSLSEKFRSGNSVDVTRATITREEWDALQHSCKETSQDAEDVDRLNFIEANPGWLRVSRLGHRTKQMWACVSPFTNYEYDLFKTAREAIDHARRVEEQS